MTSGARIPPTSAISCCIKKHKVKYRTLWPTFSLRSNSGHIHSFIPNFHVVLKVQGKITWFMKYMSEINCCYEVKGWAKLTHYPKLSFSYIKPSSRYMAKSLDHEIQVTVTHFYFEDNHEVILTHYSKVSCLYIK